MNFADFTNPDLELPGELIPGRFGYRRVSADDYHAFPAVNNTLLKCRTAAEMFAQITGGQKDTDALTIGTLVHMVALEPETSWATRFALADIPVNPKTERPYGKDTKRGKKAWEEAEAMHPGKIIVTEETLADYLAECRELQYALQCNPDAMSELTDADCEVTGIMWHPRFQCWVKWRVDILPKHCRYMADVKTTSRHVADFQKDAWQWGYHLQAAWYTHCHETLLSRLNLHVGKFPFIAISKADNGKYPRPPMCRVYDLPMDPTLNRGVAHAQTILGLPEGLSRVDIFLECCRDYVAAGCPTDWHSIRRCWPAYELESGERGRWVLQD